MCVAESARVAEELLRLYPQRRRHVAAVATSAERLIDAFGAHDYDALVAAAYLHDVGYADELRATGFHALDGARYLRSSGWPSRITSLVAHHSAAHVEARERDLLDQLMGEFAVEHSPVADALTYCDMTTGPSGEPMSVYDRLDEAARRYGESHIVTRSLASAREELVAAVQRTERLLEMTNPKALMR